MAKKPKYSVEDGAKYVGMISEGVKNTVEKKKVDYLFKAVGDTRAKIYGFKGGNTSEFGEDTLSDYGNLDLAVKAAVKKLSKPALYGESISVLANIYNILVGKEQTPTKIDSFIAKYANRIPLPKDKEKDLLKDSGIAQKINLDAIMKKLAE